MFSARLRSPDPHSRPRLRRQAARVISTLCNPFFTTLALFVILSFALARDVAQRYDLLAVTATFTTIGPLIYLVWCYKTKRISDLDMSVRSEREAVFGAFVAFYALGTAALALMHAPSLIIASMAGYTANAAIVGVITRYWKISTHASGVTAPLVALIVLFGRSPMPYLVLIPLVAWARVYLHAHTLAQVIAGTALAAISVLAFFHIYHVL